MLSKPITSPELWKQRAEEAHELARSLDDPEASRSMLEIAWTYERIADRARARRDYFSEPLAALRKRQGEPDAG